MVAKGGLTREMRYAKSTTGTHVFQPVNDDEDEVASLYVKKSAFDGGENPPKKLTLTIVAA